MKHRIPVELLVKCVKVCLRYVTVYTDSKRVFSKQLLESWGSEEQARKLPQSFTSREGYDIKVLRRLCKWLFLSSTEEKETEQYLISIFFVIQFLIWCSSWKKKKKRMWEKGVNFDRASAVSGLTYDVIIVYLSYWLTGTVVRWFVMWGKLHAH